MYDISRLRVNFLEPSGPLQACNGTALPFFFMIMGNVIWPVDILAETWCCGQCLCMYRSAVALLCDWPGGIHCRRTWTAVVCQLLVAVIENVQQPLFSPFRIHFGPPISVSACWQLFFFFKICNIYSPPFLNLCSGGWGKKCPFFSHSFNTLFVSFFSFFQRLRSSVFHSIS